MGSRPRARACAADAGTHARHGLGLAARRLARLAAAGRLAALSLARHRAAEGRGGAANARGRGKGRGEAEEKRRFSPEIFGGQVELDGVARASQRALRARHSTDPSWRSGRRGERREEGGGGVGSASGKSRPQTTRRKGESEAHTGVPTETLRRRSYQPRRSGGGRRALHERAPRPRAANGDTHTHTDAPGRTWPRAAPPPRSPPARRSLAASSFSRRPSCRVQLLHGLPAKRHQRDVGAGARATACRLASGRLGILLFCYRRGLEQLYELKRRLAAEPRRLGPARAGARALPGRLDAGGRGLRQVSRPRLRALAHSRRARRRSNAPPARQGHGAVHARPDRRLVGHRRREERQLLVGS